MSTDQRKARISDIFARCVARAIPPNVAVMQLLMECEAADEAITLTDIAIAAAEAPLLWEMRRLCEAHGQAWTTIHAILAGISHEAPGQSVGSWAADFDRVAAISPEAAVALYSLGSAELLAEATDEIIEQLHSWRLLGPQRLILDLGCGIGRLMPGLAAASGFVIGADISPRMLGIARARCFALSKVGFIRFAGKDLSPIGDRRLDLIVAVDSFPYMALSSTSLARHFFEEMARCLTTGADLVIFNFSYRGDLARDRNDVSVLAAEAGLVVRRNGTSDLTKWDGVTFHLSKPA